MRRVVARIACTVTDARCCGWRGRGAAHSSGSAQRCSGGAAPAAPAEPLPQRRRGADDQGLELVDRFGAGVHSAAASGQQHPQRFPVAAGARLGQMLSGQHFSSRSGRI
jgi:hypothetical protein